MKVNIVLSPSQQIHNKCSQGDSEDDHCRLISNKVKDFLMAYECNVLVIPEISGDQATVLSKVCSASNNFVQKNIADYSYHLDIHTDAGYVANGASGYYISEGGKAFIQKIYNEVASITPWADGIIRKRDLYVLKHTRAIAGLIEISFHDKLNESKWIHENIDLIAESIARGIAKATDIPKKKTEFDAVLKKLVEYKIISSPDYWKMCEKEGSLANAQFVKIAFENMAKFINQL